MTLGYVTTSSRGGTDRLLTEIADRLEQRGMRLCGVVQSNTECTDSDLCDMDVRVLPDGPVIRISQSLGKGARGCRLDPTALEQAVAHVGAALAETGAARPQLLIVNKFGKHEADGRGFRPLIGEAMMAGLPVLTAVNGMNHAAFDGFAEGLAQQIAPDVDAVLAWVEHALADAADDAVAETG